jgi:hypothetical protein
MYNVCGCVPSTSALGVRGHVGIPAAAAVGGKAPVCHSRRDIVAALPSYAILLLLAVPVAFAEPAKIYALVLTGEWHFATGIATMAMAYLVSLAVVERIYHAGQVKLKTISWFAKLMDWLTGIRDRLLAWARATRVWALSVQFKRTARVLVEKIRPVFVSTEVMPSRYSPSLPKARPRPTGERPAGQSQMCRSAPSIRVPTRSRIASGYLETSRDSV